MANFQIPPGKRTATMNSEKPYLGSRLGHGMPSAREPYESYSEEDGKKFDKIFPKSVKHVEYRGDVCFNKDCQFYSSRVNSQCMMRDDVKRCKDNK